MDQSEGLAPLSEAIQSLRGELTAAWRSGATERVRFRPSPVEVTLQVAVTAGGKGSAGVKWYLFSVGGEVSRETAATQTIKLSLNPVLVDDEGEEVEFLIDDVDDVSLEGGAAIGEVPLDDAE